MRQKVIFGFLILLVFGFCCWVGFGMLIKNPPVLISNRDGLMLFDANTVLEDVVSKNINVFLPVANNTPPDPDNHAPVRWDQDDYTNVANAVHQYLWNEPVDHWKLDTIEFSVGCEDAEHGIQGATYIYYQYVTKKSQKVLVQHSLYITPREGQVRWDESIYISTQAKNSYHLSEFIVPSSTALQIAEENGGKEARTRIANQCSINVFPHQSLLSADSWKIVYSSFSTDEQYPYFQYVIHNP